MREVSIKIYDDLDYRDGIKHEAAVSVTIGLDGTWAELDLTEANSGEIQRTIREWMSAGHPPDSPLPRKSGRKPGPRSAISPEARAWGKAIRAFAAVSGYSTTTANGSGKQYYSQALRQAFKRAVADFAARSGYESDSVELFTEFRNQLARKDKEHDG